MGHLNVLPCMIWSSRLSDCSYVMVAREEYDVDLMHFQMSGNWRASIRFSSSYFGIYKPLWFGKWEANNHYVVDDDLLSKV